MSLARSTDLGKPKRPRLSDVAEYCQLSKATVSRVLNLPREQCPIAESTRQRVLEAVKELGYQASWNARSLAHSRTNMIGIAYDASGAVPRGVYWEIVDELDVLLNHAGLCPMFMHTYASVGRFVENLGDGRFDGCLSLGTLPPAALEVLERNSVPTVLINADADPGWNQVGVNDEHGTELVMKHLFALGHRKIAYNAGRTINRHPSAITRAATYARCMRDAGFEPATPYVGSVAGLIEEIISGPYHPTALLDFEHWTAVRALQGLWERGLKVPEDISVATFNDAYPVEVTIPPLTVVALPAKEIAAHAVQMLLAQIEDNQTPRKKLVLEERLIVRKSTGAPPRD